MIKQKKSTQSFGNSYKKIVVDIPTVAVYTFVYKKFYKVIFSKKFNEILH